MPKKIVIITTGQPSTNPRMVKEYKALKQAGYNVKVLYSFWADWALATDVAFFQQPDIDPDDFELVGGSSTNHKTTYFLSRTIHKAARTLNKLQASFLKDLSMARNVLFLQYAAKNHKADLYIAHNLGALPVAIKAAKHYNAKCGFDAEDYHSGQIINKQSAEYKTAKQAEDKYLPQCDYITFSSNPIADAYLQEVKIKNTAVILNVVESDEVINTLSDIPATPLKLAWFSQHIGAQRGIEAIIEAINMLPDCQIELHLLGNCTAAFSTYLYSLLTNKDRLIIYPPIPPKMLTPFLKDKHIGIAAEPGRDDNNDRALSNKILSYLAAGNMILASDTTAQKDFVTKFPSVGVCYKKDDANDLATVLAHLYNNLAEINERRAAALTIAQTELNWDIVQKRLLVLVENVLQNNKLN